MRSWLLFNDVDNKIRINIPNENVNETTEDERVPTSEEVARILRKATPRGRVYISLMAFSGLRPEVLGSYEGSDGLTLGDIEEFDVDSLEFSVIPARVNVRSNLSKARFKYFTFLGEEGCKYLLDYLQERKSNGEKLMHHEDCRVCYSLSGGETTAFNHIKKQLGNLNVQNNKSQLHRFLDLWIGNGPYDFLKLHTFDTTVEIINSLQSVYDKKSSRYEASLTYGFLPRVMASLKLNKKEKSEINVLLERNLNVVAKNFNLKEDSSFADGNVIINIICSQLLLGQISLFKKIREFMKTKEMQSQKYAPKRYIINGIAELQGKYQNFFLHDLKQHQTYIIDLYASGSTEDKTFFRFLMKTSEKIY